MLTTKFNKWPLGSGLGRLGLGGWGGASVSGSMVRVEFSGSQFTES